MPCTIVAKRKEAALKEKAAVKEVEEDIGRLPDESSSDDDPPESLHDNKLLRAAEQKEEQQKDKPAAAGRKNATNGSKARVTRGKAASPALSQSSNTSVKRKSQEESKPLGSGMVDAFGEVISKKKQKTIRKVYRLKDARKDLKKSKPAPTAKNEDSPKKPFKNYNTHDSPYNSDVEGKNSFKILDTSKASSPPSPEKKFKKNEVLHDTVDEDFQPTQTQRPAFKSYDFGSEGESMIEKVLETEGYQIQNLPAATKYDDEEPTNSQLAKCPMCGKAVDPDDLREYSKKGKMNMRQQEKFCRSHQSKTAHAEWELSGYPVIDWKKLDSRISRHHAFIKQLITGVDCHYRQLLAESVDSGKNRTLLKSDFNPTPGYYGTRGKRAISENTMRKFTPLLKKRMVVDTLMAARGFTPYVEYVVVPEVAVRLIMEDMSVDAEEAREIMGNSLELGELLSEEIRDVVTRGSEEVEDSFA